METLTNEAQRVQIKTPIPGPEARRIVEQETQYQATSTKAAPVAARRGRGVWVEDVDGNVLLDFTNGMVACTGHGHPRVAEAIRQQAGEFLFFNGPDFYYEVQAKLVKRLCEITPGSFPKKVFLSNSGAEANEAAWKAVRHATGRRQALAFLGAFHGRTMGVLALTASKTVHRKGFFPTTPGVTHVPFANCYRCAYKMTYPACNLHCVKVIDDVYFKSVLPPEEVGAIFYEPIQGEGGYNVPPPGWVDEIRALADKYGIALVADEVQAGFGKTGKLFASEHFCATPDIMTLAKAMGSGLPVGATVMNAKFDFSTAGAHSNTYGGNPISCVAALATIDAIIEEAMLENAVKVGTYFKDQLQALQEKYAPIGDVRGLGLMLAIELVKDRQTKEFAKELRDRVVDLACSKGLMLLPCGVSAIRFTPALTVKPAEVDEAIRILDEALGEAIQEGRTSGYWPTAHETSP